MPTLNSHTHCQVAPADPQAKTWQRVCLFHRTTDRQSIRKTEWQPITAVWRNGGCSASYDSFVVGSSAVLRLNFSAKKPPLRQAANRWVQCYLTDSATLN
ncbi:MAG: hypothetical protein SNJ77_09120 [Cytophagales bacterium]